MARRNGVNGAAVLGTVEGAVAVAEALGSETAMLELPHVEPDAETYIAKENGHIDMHLNGSAVATFRRVHAGLLASGAKLANGRPVSSKAHVIQYVFEQLGAA